MGSLARKNHLESTRKKPYWKALQLEPLGKHHKGVLLKASTPWKAHNGILLESLTKGIRWKTLLRVPNGERHSRNPLESNTKWILLESLTHIIVLTMPEGIPKGCTGRQTKGTFWKAPKRDSIDRPLNRNPLENTTNKGFLLESLSIEPLWEALLRAPVGERHSRNPLESNTKGILLESLTKRMLWKSHQNGFYWKASQQEPFGQHNKGILLECFTTGTLWKAPQKGFDWKAPQQKSFGKHC